MQQIRNSEEFLSKLQDVMTSIYQLIQFTNDEVDVNNAENDDERGACFQISREFERPSEFLQALLDIIRVNFEPNILGTLFLNSNLGHIYEDVPDKDFYLGYISLISDINPDFKTFIIKNVMPYIIKCGYKLENIERLYAIASTGTVNYGLDLVGDANISFYEFFSEKFGEMYNNPIDSLRIGFCLDDSLDTKVRISVWMFIRKTNDK